MRLKLLASASVLCAVCATPAWSQTAASATATTAAEAPAQASDGSEGGLSDIVVTAQRRVESVQTVPIAISAFSAEALQERGITNTLEIAQYVPNMVAQANTGLGSANSFYIRGLGSTETVPTFDAPVGTYIDDIYISRQSANNLSLFDVERVEVLRGPQGTLFGRNTTGGAVSVIMAQPKFGEFGGFAEVGYGAYDKKLARGSVDIPLAPTFSAKVSGYWQDDDGYVRNVTTGQRLNDDDGWGVRLGLRGELSSSVRWQGSYAHIVADGENILNFPCNPLAPTECNGRYSSTGYRAGGSADTSPFAPLVISGRKANYLNGNHTQSNLVTSNFAIDLADKTTLTFITGYVRQAQQYGLDFYDGRSAPTLANPNPAIWGDPQGGFVILNDSYADQFSQEVKLDGQLFDGRIDYVTGFYYITETNRSDFADVFSTSPTTALLLADRTMTNTTEAYAGYAQADFNLNDVIKLTAGIRYTDETKTLDFRDNRPQCGIVNPLPATCLSTPNLIAANGVRIPTSLNAKLWTPRFAINVTPSEDLLIFASATRGFKSGGWAARVSSPANALPFAPEKVWSYEAGVKSQFFNNRVRANVTAYWMDVSDLQTPAGLVSPTGAVTFITRNFADYRNRGIEAELTFAPIDGMNLFVNGGFQDDEYIIDANAPALDEFGTRSVASQQALCLATIAAGAVGGGPGTTGVCGAGIVTTQGGIAKPVRTPDFTLSLGASYEIPFGSLALVPTVSANYRSEQEVQSANVTYYQGAVSGTNGSFTINPNGGDILVGSRSPGFWQVNAGLTLNGPDRAWQLSVTCTNCLDDYAANTYLGYNYINPPRAWLARLRYNFGR
ncbi:TonB-dependent receptor [Sphingomonas radiodurans]|uniref:TonB-dependent receptor n=1 Tax=Sphingomonas radiodurans TaxID=2890321 RepID=UPI001E35C916|nr:TonB-dependent receptor [Sphingomonas radiodurans]WBH18014.1 TonB-dependent receptor [Sphingomonas radiodurans]